MARSVQKISVLLRSEFDVFDSSNNPVTGLVDGDFTKLLSLNGANSLIVVTVTEVGNGRYQANFTPNANGYWVLTIRNATYNKRGWTEGFDVDAAGYDLMSFIIDGFTLEQTLKLIAAFSNGKLSGAPLNPVFRSQDNTANRITATCDANGNRTAVTLTP